MSVLSEELARSRHRELHAEARHRAVLAQLRPPSRRVPWSTVWAGRARTAVAAAR